MPSSYEAHLRHAKHYEALLRTTDELYQKGGNNILTAVNLFDLEWPNIQTGQAWVAAHIEEDASAQLCNTYPSAGIYLLDLRLSPRQRIPWIETALTTARRLQDRMMEGIHLGNLGSAYRDLGSPHRAIKYYEQALTIQREIGDRGGEGTALWNISLTLDHLDERARAIEFATDALKIHEEIENPDAEKVRRQLTEWQRK